MKIKFLLVIIFLTSCYKKAPDEIILVGEKFIKSNGPEINYFIEWVENFEQDNYLILKIRAESIAEIRLANEYQSNKVHRKRLKSPSKPDEEIIHDFLFENNFSSAYINGNEITLRHIQRNSELVDYLFVYSSNFDLKKYSKYIFYETGIIPKEGVNWIYHLSENWYIQIYYFGS